MAAIISNIFSIKARVRSTLVGALMLSAGVAMSAVVTTNESKLDSIFAQGGFGASVIDIRFNTIKTFFNTSLLTIDNESEWDSLRSFAGASAFPVVNMFFVDRILWCGSPTTTTVGCASVPGNMLMLDSGYASNSTLGGALAAHELSHNLGLDHMDGSNTNLMNPILSGNTSLNSEQITTILGSSLIRVTNTGQRYITITPILVAASVPEPETWAMMVAGLLGLAAWIRRRQALAA